MGPAASGYAETGSRSQDKMSLESEFVFSNLQGLGNSPFTARTIHSRLGLTALVSLSQREVLHHGGNLIGLSKAGRCPGPMLEKNVRYVFGSSNEIGLTVTRHPYHLYYNDAPHAAQPKPGVPIPQSRKLHSGNIAILPQQPCNCAQIFDARPLACSHPLPSQAPGACLQLFKKPCTC